MSDRNTNGTFAHGNPGGPGRPRRAIEREYLAILIEVASLDDWREIIAKAVQNAKDGDAKSRDWLARYLMGTEPRTPSELAADEAEMTPEQEIERKQEMRKNHRAAAMSASVPWFANLSEKDRSKSKAK